MTKVQNEEFVEFGIAEYIQVLKRRWLPAGLTILICTGLSALIAAQSNRAKYEASGKLLFQSRDPQSELTGVGADVGQLEFDTVGKNNPLENQANLLVSGALLEEVIQTLDMRNAYGELLPFHLVRRGLSVKQVRDTDILRVSYTSPDPGFSANFVNVLMRSYLKFNSKNQKYNVDSARNFIRGQLPKLRADFERNSRALRDFKAKNGVISLDSKTNEISSLSEQTLENERQVTRQLENINARSDALRRKWAQLSGDTTLPLLELSKLNDSSIIQTTLAEIQAVDSELKVQSEQYTSGHPIVIDLKLKSDSLKSVLQSQASSLLGRSVSIRPAELELSELQKKLVTELSQAEIDQQALQEEAQLLSLRRSTLGDRIANFANLEKTQLDLEQKLASSRTRYFQLLESLEKLDLTEVKIQESNQVQIIEAAVGSSAPVTGFNFKIVIAGALLGMSLAFGLALLLDILDSKIKTTEQLEKILNYPILGVIPKHEFLVENDEMLDFDASGSLDSRNNRIMALGENFAPLYASYQQIFINLTLLKQPEIPKTLAITSSLRQEGKSEIAANIAATIAQSGQEVLLVDASLRNPSQHKLWKLENNAGLSDVLYDSVNANLVRQKVAPNLHVMASGPNVMNMSIISRYAEFLAFMSQVSKQYDCIVFDTGPILLEPDSISLSRACEGTILVACLKYLKNADALNTKALLKQAEIPVLGQIINQVDKREMKKKYRAFSSHTSYMTPAKTSDLMHEELDIIGS